MLYYYDQANNLVMTMPPEGVDPISITNSDDIDQKSYSLNKGDTIIFPSSLCYNKLSSTHKDNTLIIFYAIPRPDNDKIYV